MFEKLAFIWQTLELYKSSWYWPSLHISAKYQCLGSVKFLTDPEPNTT